MLVSSDSLVYSNSILLSIYSILSVYCNRSPIEYSLLFH